MIRRGLALAFSALLLFAGAALAAPAFVQQTGTAGTICSGTIAFSAITVVVGDALLVAANSEANTTNPCVTGISDNNGGTWSSAVTTGGGAGHTCGAIYYSLNHPAGATTVSVTYGGGSASCANAQTLIEASGLLSSGALDQTATSNNTSTTTITTGTPTTTAQANELAFGFAANDYAGLCSTVTAGPTNSFSGLTCQGAQAPSTPYYSTMPSAYLILSATGTPNTAWTTSATSSGDGAIATFKASGQTGFIWLP